MTRIRHVMAFLCAFARARWRWRRGERAALLAWQQRQMDHFVRTRLPAFPFYSARPHPMFSALPVVDKQFTLERFEQMNSRGITFGQATSAARGAERSRDFRGTLPGNVTVGLSSGTSGRPGVFLVSADERARWAGAILGKLLRPGELARMANPFAPRLTIAFFLRANSNLYTTLDGMRIRFRFFDLLRSPTELFADLQALAPDILVAPASTLGSMARAAAAGRIDLRPSHVISVAETLEPDDRAAIRAAWNLAPDQVYQATEGLIGVTCETGRVHLNEEFLHVEAEWIDDRRFVPIVTDFSRTTQAIVRYRLDDVLIAAADPCPCGRPTRSLLAVDGRCDDVLWLPARAGGGLRPVYPDVIRRALALAQTECASIDEYRLVQRAGVVEIQLRGHGGHATVATALDELWALAGVREPHLVFLPWTEDVAGAKRRRIRCAALPSDGGQPAPSGSMEACA